jgi:hypothetical protein
VYLTFQFTEYESGKGTWKFNNRLLLDEEYIKIVKYCIDPLHVYLFISGLSSRKGSTK